jgi:hypothetical protein
MAKLYEYLRPEGASVGFDRQAQDLNEHGARGSAAPNLFFEQHQTEGAHESGTFFAARRA